MARTTKKKVQASLPLLIETIDQIVALEQQQAQLDAKISALRATGKDVMIELKLEHYVTPVANEALVIENTCYTWSPEKLEKVLTEEQFSNFCPPSPRSKELRELLDFNKATENPLAKKLAACAKVTHPKKLEVRPAAAMEAAAEAPSESSKVVALKSA